MKVREGNSLKIAINEMNEKIAGNTEYAKKWTLRRRFNVRDSMCNVRSQ